MVSPNGCAYGVPAASRNAATDRVFMNTDAPSFVPLVALWRFTLERIGHGQDWTNSKCYVLQTASVLFRSFGGFTFFEAVYICVLRLKKSV